MEPVKKIRGKVLPLPRADVDTDQIIPAKYLKRIERTGFGEFAFDAWRKDPDFVTERPPLRRRADPRHRPELRLRLLARARAVGAAGHGPEGHHRAVVRRHLQEQLRQDRPAHVELPQDSIDRLIARAEDSPGWEMEVDLESQTVSLSNGKSRQFDIDPFVKHCLLNGLDDVSLTLQADDSIAAFEEQRAAVLTESALRPLA